MKDLAAIYLKRKAQEVIVYSSGNLNKNMEYGKAILDIFDWGLPYFQISHI